MIFFGTDHDVISLLKDSFDAETVSSREAFFNRIQQDPGAIAMIDCDNMELNGIALFKDIKKAFPDAHVIFLSSTVTIPDAVEAAKLGVGDFLKKPLLKEKLHESIARNMGREEMPVKLDIGSEALWLLGSSHALKKLLSCIAKGIEEKKNMVLVSDPGADLQSLARIISSHSGKGRQPTIFNMRAFQKEESETFFWTVLQNAMNISDTILFENIRQDDMKKLKSIIDYIKGKAVAGKVRVVLALQKAPAGEEFSGWEIISMPSLTERKEDVYSILEALSARYSEKYGKNIKNISMDVLGLLTRYDWPGSYRELECTVENAVLNCQGDTITMKDVQIGNRMMLGELGRAEPEDLKQFRSKAEKNLVKLYYGKTSSEETSANLLDIPKARVTENLQK